MTDHVPADPGYAARVATSFGRQPFMATLGVTLDRIEPGSVTLSMAYDEAHTQQHGFLHAGAVAAVLDSACGYAAFTLMPPDSGVLTVDYTINLMAPACGDRLVATADVVRRGRTISVCRASATMEDAGDTIDVAAMQATVMTIVGRGDVRLMPSIIVVGAGIFGVSLADRLAGAGWEVDLVEQYQPGHARQSSGGASRLIRFSHGGDTWHTTMAWRARRLWSEIEDDTGADLLSRSGVVWFARRRDGWEGDSVTVLERLGIPVETHEPDDLRDLFPSVRTDDLELAVYEPDAGVLRAAAAVRLLAARASRRGATLTVARATPEGSGVRIGTVLRHADVVVWACGPWLSKVFPDLVDLTVTQQDVVFFGVGPDWSAPGVPGWVDFEASTYGTGDLDGGGFKTAPDLDGPDFDPDDGERIPTERSMTLARRYLAHRFPAIAEAPVVMTRTCQYAMTPNARWIIAPHPEHAGHWLLGGGSGHGFKHGPALAEHMEALITGAEVPDPTFGLGARDPGASLRTRGE